VAAVAVPAVAVAKADAENVANFRKFYGKAVGYRPLFLIFATSITNI
jgi:hypothetical protein